MDCYYHGYSGGPGGVCAECEEEDEKKVSRGSIQPDRDIRIARIQMGQNNPLTNPERSIKRGNKKKK